MPYIGHVLSRDDWRQFEQAGQYRPASLDQQGFIHCSKLGQVGVVADCNFEEELVLLVIDETRVDPPVRYETNERDPPSPFPHVYGPLELSAVVASAPFEPDDAGYRLPDRLLSDAITGRPRE